MYVCMYVCVYVCMCVCVYHSDVRMHVLVQSHCCVQLMRRGLLSDSAVAGVHEQSVSRTF